jgi:hypothetical protein
MNPLSVEFISQSELGRLANIPYPRVIAIVKSGKLRPAFKLGRTYAFTPAQVGELQAIAGGAR